MTRLRSKRRGVSVVISTLLVLAITIVGALTISNMMSTSALTTVNQAPKAIIAANSVVLVGYDTRDGGTLMNISNLDNLYDNPGILCTASCVTNPDFRPVDGGTDFILIHLWNKNTNSISMRDLQVNGIPHTWDFSTRNVELDGLLSVPSFPQAGKFSMLTNSSGTIIQHDTQVIEGDQEVILVIKLSETFSSDIDLGKPLKILVNIGDQQPAEYVILSGDTK